MDATRVQSLRNLHRPQCGDRLVQRAGRHFHTALRAPVYVGEVDTLTCPTGHPLPDRQELYDHRDRLGFPAGAPVAEVVPPVG
ncbi:hypothetical protein [Geodermatophilus sp. SYSU D00684]